MRRREFVQTLLLGAIAGHFPKSAVADSSSETPVTSWQDPVKDYLSRMRDPDRHYQGDIRAAAEQARLLAAVQSRLQRAQRLIGYGNFNVVSFDEILRYARHYPKVGEFDQAELSMLEQLFYEDASHYGFLGEKPLNQLTQQINRREIAKVAGSGHYLYRGKPLQIYEEIRKELGDQVILTSGIRGVVKQMHLFLSKATRFEGNLSLASRSLAPPGYSFHGVGDFDVGVPGWGARNFTKDFATTDLFSRLIDLGYVKIRYPLDNRLGVRFEPWHIKVS